MRELHNLTAPRVAQHAKIEAPMGPQSHVDTTPAGVHTPFVRQFHSFNQKADRVDMWTCGLLIIKSDQCPQIRSGAGPPPLSKYQPGGAAVLLASSPTPPHWGDPFLCPPVASTQTSQLEQTWQRICSSSWSHSFIDIHSHHHCAGVAGPTRITTVRAQLGPLALLLSGPS